MLLCRVGRSRTPSECPASGSASPGVARCCPALSLRDEKQRSLADGLTRRRRRAGQHRATPGDRKSRTGLHSERVRLCLPELRDWVNSSINGPSLTQPLDPLWPWAVAQTELRYDLLGNATHDLDRVVANDQPVHVGSVDRSGLQQCLPQELQ